MTHVCNKMWYFSFDVSVVVDKAILQVCLWQGYAVIPSPGVGPWPYLGHHF